jgi:hypothetical protein
MQQSHERKKVRIIFPCKLYFGNLQIVVQKVTVEKVIHSHYCKIFTHVVSLYGKSLTNENVAM